MVICERFLFSATAISARRLSPKVITALLEATGDDLCAYYASLAPFEPAIFVVDWAGESVSMNWIHLAREYSEQWHHQQQIREAVGQTDALMSRALFFPCIDALMRALPRAYHRLAAPEGALVEIRVYFSSARNGVETLHTRHNAPRSPKPRADARRYTPCRASVCHDFRHSGTAMRNGVFVCLNGQKFLSYRSIDNALQLCIKEFCAKM
jgi:hypothetical protein